ncbi:hypothetical protein [Streptosporangium saharense]|uniref:hypothetical protein n=1 Tax=Streptosporangium saharense TaxID=1706840 RepID=UPI00341E4D74
MPVRTWTISWEQPMRRDGARLHAGSTPADDLDRGRRKMDFLVVSGVPERDARMAMPAAGRFTVGGVLEEQADPGDGSDPPADMPVVGHEPAFESGLTLIVDGLAHRTTTDDRLPTGGLSIR